MIKCKIALEIRSAPQRGVIATGDDLEAPP